MLRFIRKHRAALIAIAIYNFALFFPVVFMGRVVSPNDIYYNHSPWAAVRPFGLARAQNALLNDPATAYFTLMPLVKGDWRHFHWNPYLASGIPGFGSSASASLTPFVLLPALLLPLTWFYTAFMFLKLNAAFICAYLWLREECLGKRGAATGAIVAAGAGAYAVRWLWQITNATALYPALLWILVRTLNGPRNSMALTALVALFYALAGFPSAMAYGAWIVVVYAAAEMLRRRQLMLRGFMKGAAATAIALLIAAPSVVPFVQFLERTGYLDARESVAALGAYPASHWRSFVDSERLGNPVERWTGDSKLGANNNYVEATIYLGLLTIPLAFSGIFNRHARSRWFWLIAALLLTAAMFGAAAIGPAFAQLPGIKYSPLARLALLLPLPIGYLAAAGAALISRRVGMLAVIAAGVIAFDLGVLAGRFHPYLEPRSAQVADTPMTRFLDAARPPFRVAPFFDYLWPNTAELVRVEDVRSQFSSEAGYRRLLARIDPTSTPHNSTVITFNSLQFNFSDPLNGLLGIRWFIEHKGIDIIKWGVFAATVPGVEYQGTIPFKPGAVLERTVRVDAEPFWAIDLPVQIDQDLGGRGRLGVSLLKEGRVVWARSFTMTEANLMNKLYVPIRPYARLNESLTLRVRSRGLGGTIGKGRNDLPREAPIFYGRVTTPVVFDRELPDGRLFRNLAELPRFRAVTRLRKLNDDEFLAAHDIDFAEEAVITDDPVFPPQLAATTSRVQLAGYAPDRQRIITESTGPFFLASSEKKTPELRVTIDGRPARIVETDLLFAGVEVPAGRHEIVYSRRIGRGWWWVAGVGAALWLITAMTEAILAIRRR